MAGLILIQYNEIDRGLSLMGASARQRVMVSIAAFIDFCCELFFDSVTLPVFPADLLNICMALLRVITNSDQPLSLKSISSAQCDGIMHSIFCGSFVVGMWTYSLQLMAQILDDGVEAEKITSTNLPEAMSLFSADICTSRFADAVPDLLNGYTRNAYFEIASLERDRLLIALLLFRGMMRVGRHFDSEPDKPWQEMLEKRFLSITRALDFIEISLGCPAFESLDGELSRPLSKFVRNEHERNAAWLSDLRKRCFHYLSCPAIFRNGSVSVGDAYSFHISLEKIRSIALMPLTNGDGSKKLVAIGRNKLAYVVLDPNPMCITESVREDPQFADLVSVVAHPQFNLYITVGRNSISLFDWEQGRTEYEFIVCSRDEIKCAIFSRNGNKLAVCSSMVEVFSFDLSKNRVTPGFLRDLKYFITAATWVDSDTTLVVAYDRNGSGELIIIDTLSKCPVPIPVKSEWGVIRVLAVQSKRGRLIYGTEQGITVVCDMKRNYERICHFKHGSTISCIGCLGDMTAVGCKNGNVLVMGGGPDPGSGTTRLVVEHSIRSMGLAADMMMVAGDSKLTVWPAR
jgi:hypothetical protein